MPQTSGIKESDTITELRPGVFVIYSPGNPPKYLDRDNAEKYTAYRDYQFSVSDNIPTEQPEVEIDKGAKYKVTIRNRYTGESIQVDIYDVLEAFKINCSAMAHALKKLLMAGKRGAKDFNKDCDEAINSVEQSKLLQKYR